MSAPQPVLSGWHPDPSVCRVGDEYYLVTSSFAFYPGLPIHRSRDLHEWELVGHALVDESWLPLGPVDVSDGIWAATIRYADGVFYLVFTVARGRTGSGLYVVTATDPAGPWSPPRELEGEGIDPSLFFDDDGRAYLTAARDSTVADAPGPGEIWLREFDMNRLELIGPTHNLWYGALARTWVEAPHIYKKNGTYHLICAEGGTERNHAVTAARATSVTGPYTTDPRSPLLSHRHLGDTATVQNVGHADIVETPDGQSWAVLLGVRPIDGHHTLGRETFLVPVEWEAAGPVFAPREGRLTAVAGATRPAQPPRDWISLRGPAPATVAGSTVTLAPRPTPLDSLETPPFLGVRQHDHSVAFEASLDIRPIGDQDAGLVALQGGNVHLTVHVADGEHGKVVKAQHREGALTTTLGEVPASERVRLGIHTSPHEYRLVATVDRVDHVLARVPHDALSTETAGGFVGVTLGLFNIGATDAAEIAFYDTEYRFAREGRVMDDLPGTDLRRSPR
ncbi:family 43 glycosylhydrolase [Microbacterium sp. NPDC019599]|uniref:glycoside hydrolase family 43 protein n=1 Tax=Microbacterium sp. NPDC019599 TaxID=3154690 RepID=UPI0034043027